MTLYPVWIDDYARSSHKLMSSMVPGRWSSLNGFAVFPAYQGAFLNHICELVEAHVTLGTSSREAWKLFANPSDLRATWMFLIWEYQHLKDKDPLKEKVRIVFDWFADILYSDMQDDAWAFEKNLIHTKQEVSGMLARLPWVEGDGAAVKNAGKLYVSAASMCFALYRDFFPQQAHEIFGPYDASERFGSGATLIVKYFPKIHPTALWSEVADFPHEYIRIYQVLKGINFRCGFIGMHSEYDGLVVPNTVAVSVEVGGTSVPADEVAVLAASVAESATQYSYLYDALDLAAAKKKFVEWECFTFEKVFSAAGMDWHPTPEMLAPVMAADIGMGARLESFPPYDEYVTSKDYDIYWLKELYVH